MLRVARTDALDDADLRLLRSLADSAFGARFSDDDWHHALGGVHFVVEHDDVPIAHASVVDRTLRSGTRRLRTGYVEAVCTQPAAQRQGHASMAMRAAATWISEMCELGALSTGQPAFYERLGWERWRGPILVDAPGGEVRLPDEEGGVMILRTPRTGDLDVHGPLACDWRVGDVW